MDECPHGMEDPAWCSICKHGPTRNLVATVERYFTAKLDGQCPACDLPIMRGQRIAKLTDGNYIHGACVEKEGVKPLF